MTTIQFFGHDGQPKSPVISSGIVDIQAGSHAKTSSNGNSVTIGIAEDAPGQGGWETYVETLGTSENPLPYLVTLNNRMPDNTGNMWIRGSRCSQVDMTLTVDSKLAVTDVCAPNVDIPDYVDIYDMLDTLRNWLDAMKDNTLCDTNEAAARWVAMDPDHPRPADVLPATKLFLQYKALVTYWNKLLYEAATVLSLKVHDKDPASIIVGFSTAYAYCLNSSRIQVQLSIQLISETQSVDDAAVSNRLRCYILPTEHWLDPGTVQMTPTVSTVSGAAKFTSGSVSYAVHTGTTARHMVNTICEFRMFYVPVTHVYDQSSLENAYYNSVLTNGYGWSPTYTWRVTVTLTPGLDDPGTPLVEFRDITVPAPMLDIAEAAHD